MISRRGFKFIGFAVAITLLTSCTIYTEKRSESLSQAVYATAEGIKNARFEKAFQFAEQAKRLAYAPKNPIPVPPIITKETKSVTAINSTTKPIGTTKGPTPVVGSSIITKTTENDETETVIRLVVPEFLKDAKLLIENSEEWNELLKTKEFKEFLEQDNKRLEKLVKDIDEELKRQQEYNNQMVIKISELEKALERRNTLVLKLYIVIFGLVLAIAGGIYLRIKGIL